MKGPFSPYSGYGNDLLGLTRALVEWGCDVFVQPTWLDVPVPRDLLPLFGRALDPPFDLTINHWSPGDLDLGRGAREVTRLAVAWTMWEFGGGPQGSFRGCSNARVSSMRERLRWFDLVLGYDPLSIQAMAPYCARHTARGVLLGGFESAPWKPAKRDWSGDRFGYLMHGALNRRKMAWTSIQAFNELRWEHKDFAAHATLSLHNSVGGIPQELEQAIPKLRIFQQTFDSETLYQFYASNHMLLAPSLGEGKNLPALEMGATGGTMACTNFGGHTMWPLGEVGYPLDYTQGALMDKYPGGAQAAYVSIPTLKAAMWDAFSNRAEAQRRGDLAAQLIPAQCDWRVVVEHLWRRIRDLVPHNGELIFNMAQQCRREPVWRGGR